MPWRDGVLPARAGIAASGSRAAIVSAGLKRRRRACAAPQLRCFRLGLRAGCSCGTAQHPDHPHPGLGPLADHPAGAMALCRRRFPHRSSARRRNGLQDPEHSQGVPASRPAPRPSPCAGGWASPRSGRAADPESPRRDVGFLIRLDGFYETVRQFPHCLNDISRSPATRDRALRQHRQDRYIGYIPVRYKNSCFPHLTWRAIARLHAVGNRALWEGGGSFSSSFQRHPGLSPGEGACPAHGAGRPPVAAPDGSKRGRRMSWLHLKRCSMCAGNP